MEQEATFDARLPGAGSDRIDCLRARKYPAGAYFDFTEKLFQMCRGLWPLAASSGGQKPCTTDHAN
jgi:hypothetical protein